MLLNESYEKGAGPSLRRSLLALSLGAAISLFLVATAHALSPTEVCRGAGTSDTLRKVPSSLAGAINALFDTRMSPEEVARSTFYRCSRGRVLVCTVGANLPCAKANVSRTIPGATAYCRQNPGSDFIPAFATGRDTIFQWRCLGPKPAVVRQTLQVDARGFSQQYWKALP
jgi:hypothetical protein